jgi:acyl carrier protein
MISRERIKEDVINYIVEQGGDENISEEDEVSRYGMDDFDLVDLEMELERKYKNGELGEESAVLWEYDTVGEVIDKLYKFFNPGN